MLHQIYEGTEIFTVHDTEQNKVRLEYSKSTPPLICPEVSLRAALDFLVRGTCGLVGIGLAVA